MKRQLQEVGKIARVSEEKVVSKNRKCCGRNQDFLKLPNFSLQKCPHWIPQIPVVCQVCGEIR